VSDPAEVSLDSWAQCYVERVADHHYTVRPAGHPDKSSGRWPHKHEAEKIAKEYRESARRSLDKLDEKERAAAGRPPRHQPEPRYIQETLW
jgi:hypothetical protein